MITFTGKMKLYFNRHGAAPLVWCVAGDGFELAVAELVVNAPVVSRYQPKATADEDDGKPSAWLEVDGSLAVDQTGRALIAPVARVAEFVCVPDERNFGFIAQCQRCGKPIKGGSDRRDGSDLCWCPSEEA